MKTPAIAFVASLASRRLHDCGARRPGRRHEDHHHPRLDRTGCRRPKPLTASVLYVVNLATVVGEPRRQIRGNHAGARGVSAIDRSADRQLRRHPHLRGRVRAAAAARPHAAHQIPARRWRCWPRWRPQPTRASPITRRSYPSLPATLGNISDDQLALALKLQASSGTLRRRRRDQRSEERGGVRQGDRRRRAAARSSAASTAAPSSTIRATCSSSSICSRWGDDARCRGRAASSTVARRPTSSPRSVRTAG